MSSTIYANPLICRRQPLRSGQISIFQRAKEFPVHFPFLELKSGFLLLGGGVTTVIGYYFGSRGTQEAEAGMALYREEVERVRREDEAKERTFRKLMEDFTPTGDEDSLQDPDQMETPGSEQD